LFLQYGGSQNGVNLNWQQYQVENGSLNFKSYQIFKSSDSLQLSLFDSLSSNTNVYTDIDPLAMKKRTYYRVYGVMAVACAPTDLHKAESGPFIHSISNLEDNRLRSNGDSIDYIQNIVFANQVSLYPNPGSSRITIDYRLYKTSDVSANLLDITGNEMGTLQNGIQLAGQQTIGIDIQKMQLKDGIYYVKMLIDGKRAILRMMVMR
jgi:hypothetical protein